MTLRKSANIFAAAVCFSALSVSGFAQEAKLYQVGMLPQETVEESAEERINFSGKLRMLSQRIASAACHYTSGIDKEGSHDLLAGATAEFEKILTALEFGDDSLNIQEKETRKKTLQAVHSLRETWTPIKVAATTISDGNGSDADVALILNENLALLGRAQALVSELVKQYSNPNSSTFANLMLIDISGRQRMLTQKMSKETCILASSGPDVQTVEALDKTMAMFETSLEALRHGLPAVGVNPPPNGQISSGLEVVLDHWTAVKPILVEAKNGADLSESSHEVKFQQLNVTMARMNEVVGMYVAATKKTY